MSNAQLLIQEAVGLTALSPELRQELAADLQLSANLRLLNGPFLREHFPRENGRLQKALTEHYDTSVEEVLSELSLHPAFQEGLLIATKLTIRSWVQAMAPHLRLD